MNYKEIIESKAYDFLRTNPLLKDRLLFLVIGGSHSYGTNNENSDLDIRGIVLERETDTLGLTDFEHYIDPNTDTVIYTLKKFLKLVKECNPNVIEMLFCKKEHYFYMSPLGEMLIKNRNIFLSKRAAYSFGGYANAQLNRLENAMARDVLKPIDTLIHINRSIENVGASFETKFDLPINSMKSYVGQWKEGEDEEILIDFNLSHYPLSRLRSMISEMTNVVRDYNNSAGKRNKKKDDAHLNKHMMHLIRLFYMGNEILEYKTVQTYREKEHDLLMNIRNGLYREKNGYVKKEFYDLLNSLKEKFDILKETTTLPEFVDDEKYNKLVLDLYKKVMFK